ncbi:hypothetical protein [Flavobacterium sp.]|uniref:hypothetical protein n=1 Tax=Flavobacterium sp. TaxID=239 RepID=UPI00261C780F|nr:hypothetical protein [Flavobacterium sp.]
MKKHLFTFLSFLVFNASFGQPKSLKVNYFYPKDSLQFNQQFEELEYNYDYKTFGKTTMIVHCESAYGTFDFIFKKQIFKLSRILEYENTSVSEVFDFKTKTWKLTDDSNPYQIATMKVVDTINYSEHNSFALIVAHDHGGIIQKAKFQDFGNVVYWPEFDYPNCSISDENKDGIPEFYLSYFGNSDGLDAKPYKQIVYTFNNKNIEKSKATSYYPSGNEGDKYYIENDENWKKLPISIQKKSQNLIKNHQLIFEKKN